MCALIVIILGKKIYENQFECIWFDKKKFLYWIEFIRTKKTYIIRIEFIYDRFEFIGINLNLFKLNQIYLNQIQFIWDKFYLFETKEMYSSKF